MVETFVRRYATFCCCMFIAAFHAWLFSSAVRRTMSPFLTLETLGELILRSMLLHRVESTIVVDSRLYPFICCRGVMGLDDEWVVPCRRVEFSWRFERSQSGNFDILVPALPFDFPGRLFHIVLVWVDFFNWDSMDYDSTFAPPYFHTGICFGPVYFTKALCFFLCFAFELYVTAFELLYSWSSGAWSVPTTFCMTCWSLLMTSWWESVVSWLFMILDAPSAVRVTSTFAFSQQRWLTFCWAFSSMSLLLTVWPVVRVVEGVFGREVWHE